MNNLKLSIDMLYPKDDKLYCYLDFSTEKLLISVNDLIKRIHKFHSFYIDSGVIISGDIESQKKLVDELINYLERLNIKVIID